MGALSCSLHAAVYFPALMMLTSDGFYMPRAYDPSPHAVCALLIVTNSYRRVSRSARKCCQTMFSLLTPRHGACLPVICVTNSWMAS